MGAGQRWRSLTWRERGRLSVFAIALPCIDLLLRAAGYQRLHAGIERITPQAGSRQATAGDIEAGERLARHVAMAGRHIPLFNTSCLRQALLVHGCLRRRGLAPVLMIGIRPRPGLPDAHAWVELDGIALAQANLAHRPFVPGREAA